MVVRSEDPCARGAGNCDEHLLGSQDAEQGGSLESLSWTRARVGMRANEPVPCMRASWRAQERRVWH